MTWYGQSKHQVNHQMAYAINRIHNKINLLNAICLTVLTQLALFIVRKMSIKF